MDPDSAPARFEALRARLAISLMRGLAHEIANTVQMLSLDPPPPGALAAARERLGESTEVIATIARASDPEAGPSLLPDVLKEVVRWMSLQAGLSEARLEHELAPALPALALGQADARSILLAVITDAREHGTRRFRLRAEQADGRIRCDLVHGGAPPPSAASIEFAVSRGVDVRVVSGTHIELSFAAATRVTGSA